LSPRDAVRGLAIGRIAIGVASLLFPRLAGRLSVGPDGGSDAVTVMMRALGVRDAVLGGMTLHTLGNAQVARRWISTCGAIDAVDCAAAFAARRALPPSARMAFYVIAGGSAVAHAALSQRIADEPAPAS
jgi:hypothetical protein